MLLLGELLRPHGALLLLLGALHALLRVAELVLQHRCAAAELAGLLLHLQVLAERRPVLLQLRLRLLQLGLELLGARLEPPVLALQPARGLRGLVLAGAVLASLHVQRGLQVREHADALLEVQLAPLQLLASTAQLLGRLVVGGRLLDRGARLPGLGLELRAAPLLALDELVLPMLELRRLGEGALVLLPDPGQVKLRLPELGLRLLQLLLHLADLLVLLHQLRVQLLHLRREPVELRRVLRGGRLLAGGLAQPLVHDLVEALPRVLQGGVGRARGALVLQLAQGHRPHLLLDPVQLRPELVVPAADRGDHSGPGRRSRGEGLHLHRDGVARVAGGEGAHRHGPRAGHAGGRPMRQRRA
mmetsp:Transcript_30541/g.81012  ORF Transcript_30541/g.81012 Transcript_30541/m.81012 type:complete len:359 (+) Transcript_30541:493-1569(+)